MYCLVSTFNKTFDELGLIYFIPSFLEKEIKKWQIVEVPVWNKIEIALVLETWNLKELNILDIEEEKIKSIISIKNSEIFLNKNQIELIRFISKNYFCHIHQAVSLFFPKNLKEKIVKGKIELKTPLDTMSGGIKNSTCINTTEKKKEKIKKEIKLEYSFIFDKKLSEKQNSIFEKINNSDNKKFLLHWVTGSWKTEIYIKLIKEQLDQGKQSLLLIPEIILNNQLETRLQKVFWKDIITINSTITEASKTKAWKLIYSNEAKIIIWTRSSLFYPHNNLWLIIIDEEHDNSYISDKNPRYNTIEIANKITVLNWNKLLLASWTPSINSMYEAVKNKYKLISLLEKFEN